MAHEFQTAENHEMGNIENGNGHYKDDPNPAEPHHGHLDILHHHKKKHRRLPKGIKEAGESGRGGIHPLHFFRICGRSSSHLSMAVNILWPFVPAAIVAYYKLPDHPQTVFALNFLAMIPTANLIGFAGQELARKLPIVFGTILECLIGSLVELVLLLILLLRPAADQERNSKIVKDAILGSILANMLLCLGVCFWVGGLRESSQKFHGSITEAGTGLLLVIGFALTIPAAFSYALGTTTNIDGIAETREPLIQAISRAAAIVLLIAWLVYVFYQLRSHHNIFADVLEADEEQDKDGHFDRLKDKLTLTECVIALLIALTFVCLHAFYLVVSIDGIIEQTRISEMFLGLILVPLVEKMSEHLTAVDEAWDNTPNIALSHIIGSTLQTALLNAPLVVIIAWGRDLPMDLNFSSMQVILLILAILVVGQFLRDGESNYLEGILCVMVYVLIAVAAWYYPNDEGGSGTQNEGSGSESSTGGSSGESGTSTAEAMAETATEAAIHLARAAMYGVTGRRVI